MNQFEFTLYVYRKDLENRTVIGEVRLDMFEDEKYLYAGSPEEGSQRLLKNPSNNLINEKYLLAIQYYQHLTGESPQKSAL